MSDETGLVKEIKSYLSQWESIETLGDLSNEELRKFWESLESVVFDICLELKTRDNIDTIFPAISHVIVKLIRLGEFIRAEAINLELWRAGERVNDRNIQLRAGNFLGFIYFNLFEFDKAQQAYVDGLALLGDDLEDQTRRVVYLSNLSMVAAETENLESATRYAHDALRLIHTLPPKAFDKASKLTGTPGYDEQRSAAMSNLGALYNEMGTTSDNPGEKEFLLRRSLRYNYRSSKGRIPRFDRIRSHANKGLSLMHLGKEKDAYELFKRLDKRCDNDPELVKIKAWIQGFMAETALFQGKPDLAVRHCHSSLRLAIRSSDPIRENATMVAVMKPLKAISSKVFQGNSDGQRFLEEGMPLIQELLDFLEDKDWYTARAHARGVAGISTRLYDVLMETHPGLLKEHDRQTLKIASLLHDIGKLWIPWGILNRLTPLWDREFEIIKLHPVKGQEFLEELGFADIGGILGRHHERPDGAGYPNGGDIGCMPGRILAVADCFEAMTTPNRLYRKPYTREAAVRRMQTLAGRQFDETVVNLLPMAVERL